ncbi:MAG TPA: 4-hydroxy-tetrahydrodipicolinate reductase [Leptospiraceae bacterium]|nr:4-hydroxy-tetrahydrodipicolinate reductase [Leptospiraceae bacterium]HMX34638.1 4-hydroxy-tetrahydrodipicolinate reductase [Leptospiraceae bacterium]HMY32021.1 4-hydroxy-tetrahydrodipicolinate reductase [Leptospiraceae bacterium]HMZ66244.1 4-hydroxy-tetrahydrodipicolinate reductase [Leptospiraceae bacterium]HNA07416.1 4-hydroxy-tetrahydrodipicolinate reductase [Leptospiraceae bacterium]
MSRKGKLKVTLIGSAGRMGVSITQVLSKSEKSELFAAVEHEKSPLIGKDIGIHAGLGEIKKFYTSSQEDAISEGDVIIDFSTAENSKKVLDLAVKHGKPLVIGVTGLEEDFLQKIREASVSIPILQSPNMSVGVNLLFKLAEMTARVLGDDYDIEILDIHHRHKKDSPSGTAMRLKEVLLSTLGRGEENVIYGRHGKEYGERDKREIAVHSMRAGEVVGDHTAYFFSADEAIEISHKARDRRTFAVGAVKAAEFVSEQKIGSFHMFDVLGL